MQIKKKSNKKDIVVSPYANSLRKRVFDLVLVGVGIFLFWPIFLIINLAILITSGWPVIFSQKRVGKDGKVFVMYKFRTMIRGAEKLKRKYMNLNEVDGPVFKIRDDPRFVGIGKWLARSGLDEIPQLWNVLKGEMSLVGPRPLPVDEVKDLSEYEKRRHLIRPGITSTWVVEGAHDLPFSFWMEKDLDYVKNSIVKDDLGVILRTLAVIVRVSF